MTTIRIPLAASLYVSRKFDAIYDLHRVPTLSITPTSDHATVNVNVSADHESAALEFIADLSASA